MTDISVTISDDPVSVSVSNAPGPSGASSFFKGMAAAWPPTATPTAGWIYTLPDPVPAGTPAGFLAGYGAQWDGITWTNIGPVRGPAGPAGPQGVAGSAGSPGVAGTAATITVGSVTTGAAGTSASVVNAGTSSAAVLNITIPRGDAGASGSAGAAGPQGPQGPAGSAGAAATVSVGTVTTGAAGSSASVTNVGTSAAAVLDIAIPRGDTGAAGVAGPAGAAGVAGPQGPAGAAGATGPAGSSGVISVTAPITNSGTSSAAALGITIGTTAGTVAAGDDSRFSPIVATPTSLAADVNDWSIGAGDIFRVAGTAARNVTGIAAGTSGQTILLVNVGSFALTLRHQSASSTAANRFTTPWAGDLILAAAGGNAVLVYDGTLSTWRVL